MTTAYDADDDQDYDDADGQVISEDAAEEMFREALDEQGPIRIGECDYDVSRVLEAVDPIAYRCGLNDFIDVLVQDGTVVEGWE